MLVPKENAVLTSFASARISAPVDDVFAVLLKYNDYSKWSCFQHYKWQAKVDGDGAPPVGSKGSFQVFFDFIEFFASSPSFRYSLSIAKAELWQSVSSGPEVRMQEYAKMF